MLRAAVSSVRRDSSEGFTAALTAPDECDTLLSLRWNAPSDDHMTWVPPLDHPNESRFGLGRT